MPLVPYRFGDYRTTVAARTAEFAALLRGASKVVSGDGIESVSRLQALGQDLGRRFPDQAERIAAGLAVAPIPELAALRLLDADPAALLDQVLLDDDRLAAFCIIASSSTLYGRLLAKEPHSLIDREGRIVELTRELEQLCDEAEGLPATKHAEAIDRATLLLRTRKRLEMLGVVLAEVTQSSDILATASEIARIAAEAIATAVRFAERLLRADAQHVVVLGMGKLGGRELNLSSDVDLIFACEPPAATTDLGQAGAVARLVTSLIDDVTHGGPVFRVDLRLRPFGTQGAIIHTTDELVTYYESHGRTWERGALIKARAVGGDIALGERLLERLRPFVFPKVIDESVIEEIASTKRAIDASLLGRAARGTKRGFDLKLGSGGIREIEFFAQAFQLVFGGREPDVAIASTVPALQRITLRGHLPERDCLELTEAYRFLRLLEHRVQMDEERQTHEMPVSLEERRRLAWRLGFASPEALEEQLEAHRETVSRRFASLFARGAAEPSPDAWIDAVLDGAQSEEARLALLEQAGFVRPRRVLADLTALASPPDPVLGPHAPAAIREAATRFVAACSRTALPDRAMERAFEAMQVKYARSQILEIVRQRPRAATVLASLFGASENLGRSLVRNPGFIDILLGASAKPALDLDELREELARLLSSVDDRTSGSQREPHLQAIRRFRLIEELRLGLGRLSGRLSTREASRGLADLADVCLESTKQEALFDLGDRIDRRFPPRLGLLAFGKLGGREMGHGSDLDLVFVFDDDLAQTPHYARFAQRWLSFVSTPMVHGRLYTADMRLRPDGSQGAAVTTVEGLCNYYAERAWPWERLALLRARPVASSARISKRLDTAIDEVLAKTNLESVREAIVGVRAKRLSELAQKSGPLDFKLMAGGLADLEIAVQWMQLSAIVAGTWQGKRRGNTWEALERLQRLGTLPKSRGKRLAEALEFYRSVENWVRLSEGDQASTLPAAPDRRMAVALRTMGDRRRAARFDAEIAERAEVVQETLTHLGLSGS